MIGNSRLRRFKQSAGAAIIHRLPFNQHVFAHVRLELNGMLVRALHQLHPGYRRKLKELRDRRGIRANIGCGPFGLPGWVNLDLFTHQNVSLRADCRFKMPFADRSCGAIHVEHFFEHLCPLDERPAFLRECFRCLQPEGIVRIIVPDAELYIRAYASHGWTKINALSCGGDIPEQSFRTKMDALNHVFLQEAEHYGGYDADTLTLVLADAGFSDVRRESYRSGRFPGGCIDREQHRPYSLYFEAMRP